MSDSSFFDSSDLDDIAEYEMIMEINNEDQDEVEAVRMRRYINHERDVAEERLMADYFGSHPKYPAEYFRRRYRIRELFLEIVQGANNDITVLHHSPLFDDLLADNEPVAPYVVNGQPFDKGYYLAVDSMCEFAIALQVPTWSCAALLWAVLRSMRHELNKLPSRVNLDRKGIELDSMLCPICHGDVETVNHIFFNRDMAKDLWSLLASWWDLDILMCANIMDWFDWLDSLHVTNRARAFLEGSSSSDLEVPIAIRPTSETVK
ncbi:RNA-directed DNA polymerase, eukaryota [Tanacetum coccineum]